MQQHNDADVVAKNSGGDGTNISDDLQKLQSMIMELNVFSSQNMHGIGFLLFYLTRRAHVLEVISAHIRQVFSPFFPFLLMLESNCFGILSELAGWRNTVRMKRSDTKKRTTNCTTNCGRKSKSLQKRKKREN